MSELRIEYEMRETTKNGFVDGVDTGTPDDLRTFEQGPPRYYVDDVEVDEPTFRRRAMEMQ